MVPASKYASFMVRVWYSDESGGLEEAHEWHGEVEHIQTCQSWSFETLDELLALMQDQAKASSALDRR